MLGFSLYFEEDKKLLVELEKHQGYDIFFTSLHYPSSEEIFKKFLDLFQLAKDLDLDICVDINNKTLEKYPELVDMGLILRLDFGFSIDEIRNLSHKTRLAINGSTVAYESLKNLADNRVDMENIIGWHNYYPLDLSGIGRDFFKEQNNLIREFKMMTAAFVPGNDKLRGPIYKGLPTLEDHRFKNPYVSIVDLKRSYDIDICLTAETVKAEDEIFIKKFFNQGIVSLPVTLDKNFRDLEGLKVRPDISPYIIRNNRIKKDVKPNISQYIHRGDILVCNNLSGRYAGEIEIARKDLGIMEDRNVIGNVDREYLELLNYIKGDDEIVFNRK